MSSNVSFLMDLDKGGSSAPLQDAHIQLEEGWMGLRLSSRTRNVYIEEIENLVRGYDSRCLRVWQDKLKKVSSYLISIRETALNEFLKKIPGNETDRLQNDWFHYRSESVRAHSKCKLCRAGSFH